MHFPTFQSLNKENSFAQKYIIQYVKKIKYILHTSNIKKNVHLRDLTVVLREK